MAIGKEGGSEGQQRAVADRPSIASPMMLVESFLFALTNSNKDGRVVMDKQGDFQICTNVYTRMHTYILLTLKINLSLFLLLSLHSMSGSEQSKVPHAECSSSLCAGCPGMQGRHNRWGNDAACKHKTPQHACMQA